MDNNNDFLEELQNNKYINEKEIEEKQNIEDKKQDKIDKKENKINSKITKAQKLEEKFKEKQENKINESTEIIGKTKRQLLAKINKYKKLFKNELSDYKINKNASEDDLKNHITNIQDILDSSEIDNYINDSIYHCIKLIEPFTSKSSRYNITGLSSMLKLNPQFDIMCKKLMLKYNCFTNTPIEYQMIMLVSTSVYLTIQMNQSKPAMEQFLNQKI